MSITIKVLKESQHKEWNLFLTRSNNGTVFHNLDFLNYHPKDRFNEHHLMIYRKGNLCAVMPMAISVNADSQIAESPYGGSFGGPAISNSLVKFRQIDDLVTALKTYLSDTDISQFVVSCPPSIYYNNYSCYLEYCFAAKGFELIKRDVTSVVVLEEEIGKAFQAFEGRTRTSVKRAEKLQVQCQQNSEKIEDFYQILLDAKARHQATPTHTLDELKRIIALCPGSIKLDLAFVEQEPIAGNLYFICNKDTILAFYIAHKSGCEKYNASSLLLYRAMGWAINNGFRYLDLGKTTDGMRASKSVFEFKESFGTVGYFRDTYCINLDQQ